MGQEESAVDGCEEKSEETEVPSVGVIPHRGDDAWTVLAGLTSQASDLFSHSGPPPEEGVLCSVCTSRNSESILNKRFHVFTLDLAQLILQLVLGWRNNSCSP